MKSGFTRAGWAFGLWLALGASALLPPAHAAEAPTLTFDIRSFSVTGNTLLPPARIDKALAPYIGPRKDFGDVQRALEALQDAYVAAGYGVVLVTLPEQELDQGVVKLAAIEPKLGKVEIEGNKFYDNENIRRSLPSMEEGKTPNSLAMAGNLRLANQNPSKGQQVLLRAGANEGEVDAVVRVTDSDPKRYSVNVDSTGTKSTGYFRVGLGFQQASFWDRDIVVTGQYITSPDHYEDVTILALGASVPFYSLGDSLDLVLAYSSVNSGTVQNLFNVAGAGWVFSARYNKNLPRIFEGYEQKLVFGYDQKRFQNSVVTVGAGVGLVPDITIQPLSLVYNGVLKRSNQQLGFYFGGFWNPFNGGGDQSNEAFSLTRQNATPSYHLGRAGATYVYATAQDFQFRFNGNMQWTRDALIPAEQIGLGGMYNIRGFTERQYSADQGWWANFELYTPNLGPWLEIDGSQLRFLAFRDTGWGKFNYNQPPQNQTFGLDSYGAGIRYLYKESFSLRVDLAKVTHDGAGATSADGRRHSGRISMAAVFSF